MREDFENKWGVLVAVETGDYKQCEAYTYDGSTLIVGWPDKDKKLKLDKIEPYYDDNFVKEFIELTKKVLK